jgi:hypothetical protein
MRRWEGVDMHEGRTDKKGSFTAWHPSFVMSYSSVREVMCACVTTARRNQHGYRTVCCSAAAAGHTSRFRGCILIRPFTSGPSHSNIRRVPPWVPRSWIPPIPLLPGEPCARWMALEPDERSASEAFQPPATWFATNYSHGLPPPSLSTLAQHFVQVHTRTA